MDLINRFHQIDIEGKGSVAKQYIIKAVEDSKEATYDQARETLKEVNLDSSGRVELEDYVDVSAVLDNGLPHAPCMLIGLLSPLSASSLRKSAPAAIYQLAPRQRGR